MTGNTICQSLFIYVFIIKIVIKQAIWVMFQDIFIWAISIKIFIIFIRLSHKWFFRVFFINFNLQTLNYNFIFFNFIFTVTSNDLLPIIRMLFGTFWVKIRRFWYEKPFDEQLNLAFIRERFYPIKSFVTIENGNSRLAQAQKNMADGIAQTKWTAFFLVLF